MLYADSFPIRAAGHADSAALLAMMRLSNSAEGIEIDRERLAAGLAKLLDSLELGAVLIAGPAEEPLGYAVVTFGFDLELGGRDAFLTELFVRARERRCGVGRRLLAAAEAHALASGAAALHLAVRPENEPAFDLYRASGFEPLLRVLLSKRLGPRPR